MVHCLTPLLVSLDYMMLANLLSPKANSSLCCLSALLRRVQLFTSGSSGVSNSNHLIAIDPLTICPALILFIIWHVDLHHFALSTNLNTPACIFSSHRIIWPMSSTCTSSDHCHYTTTPN